MEKWLWGYVGTAVTIGMVVVVQNLWHLSTSDWAAWAQAVGTVAAVIGAVAIAFYQTKQARRSQEARDTDLDVHTYRLLQSIIFRLYRFAYTSTLMLDDATVADSMEIRRQILREARPITSAVAELPIHVLPDFEAVSALLDARQLCADIYERAFQNAEESPDFVADPTPWHAFLSTAAGILDAVSEASKKERLSIRHYGNH